jgi:hypothetical protein
MPMARPEPPRWIGDQASIPSGPDASEKRPGLHEWRILDVLDCGLKVAIDSGADGIAFIDDHEIGDPTAGPI